MKILISAYACQPNKGSEPGVGWNWAINLSKYHEVYVITRLENREAIEAYFLKYGRKFKVIYHGNKQLEYLKNKIPYGNNIYCNIWQKTLIKKITKLHEYEKFDVCHHLTYASFKYPSYLHKLGIPFVLGPIGGGEKTPISLVKTFNFKNRVIELIREIQIRNSIKRKSILRMFEKAGSILVTTRETQICIPKEYREKTKIMQTIGIDKEEIVNKNRECIGSKKIFNILFVAEIKMWKGLELIIRIAEELKKKVGLVEYKINVIGSGPDKRYFEKQIKARKLQDMFNIYPRVAREKVLDMYIKNDLFLFPSYHDSGGMVVLEAMSKGIPVVVLDTGGPGINVTEKSGFKIECDNSLDEIVNGFVESIEEIVNLYNSNKINEYIDNAYNDLINKHIWEVKAKEVIKEYMKLLRNNQA